MSIRLIEKKDYSSYAELIDSKISKDLFDSFLDNVLGKKHYLFVIEKDSRYTISSKKTDVYAYKTVIGTGTLLVESKLTHGGCIMGHIENILIHRDFRGQGLGEKLVKYITDFSEKVGCYRTDLTCTTQLLKFYQKIGYTKLQNVMTKNFPDNYNK